jgi:hypothetical protein
MKRFALVKSGKVTDVVISSGPDRHTLPEGVKAVESETANIGDTHDGANFYQTYIQYSPEELEAYARFRQSTVVRAGIKFNLASPGNDPDIIHVPTDATTRETIRELAYLASEDGAMAPVSFPSRTVVLTVQQIIRLRKRIAEHVARSQALLSRIVGAIGKGQIASREHIDSPETATAIQLEPWWDPYV